MSLSVTVVKSGTVVACLLYVRAAFAVRASALLAMCEPQDNVVIHGFSKGEGPKPLGLAVVTNRDALTKHVGDLYEHILVRVCIHPLFGVSQGPRLVRGCQAIAPHLHCVHICTPVSASHHVKHWNQYDGTGGISKVWQGEPPTPHPPRLSMGPPSTPIPRNTNK